MPGRLGVDFGTSNTVLAVWDAARREGVPLHVPDYGRRVHYRRGDSSDEAVSLVPSLVHYVGGRRWVGNQVLQQDLSQSERTFRWMKRYVGNRSQVKVRLDGREVTHFDAGRDFLAAVLTSAAAELGLRDEEVAFTVPVESYEHYEDWLAGVAEAVGMPRFRLIDEASAAALGYGAHVQPGQVYLILDLGGGTLDVAAVLIEGEPGETGRRCRVLGKAGAEVGGMSIDQWLFQEVLRRCGRHDSDDDVRRVSRLLLRECERAKERLSTHDRADVSVLLPDGGAMLGAEFTRGEFEDLLDRHELLTRIDQTVRRALSAARERGYDEESVYRVLLVGGGSLIPCVRRTAQRIFGRERVLLDRPLDAVARGAAAFVAGVDFYDHIQHDYAVRYVDPVKGDYGYRLLVRRGTPYPTTEPVRLTVKASHDGQAQLGLAIFELGELRRRGGTAVELVFDPAGAARVVEVSADEEERRAHYWINEKTPTFLVADPPARQGEARFEVEFDVDANKRLVMTARDLTTGRLTHRDYPVVKLT